MDIRICESPGCKYIAMKTSTLCSVHEMQAIGLDVNAVVLGVDYCEVPACGKPREGVWFQMDLCKPHLKYAEETDRKLARMQLRINVWRWLMVALVVVAALEAYAIFAQVALRMVDGLK